MKVLFHSLFILLFVFTACTSTPKQATIDYTQYVNPFIGTDFTGNTYPGAQVPFGMVQLSPDNGLPGWDRISGYFYPDSTIAGFSHTHLSGTGAGDLYDISFMPVTLPYKEAEAPLGIYSKFSHQDENATAGYYQVLLKDYGINVELTATERCGIQRYTFPEAKAAIFLNLKKAMNWDFTNDSHIEVIDSVTIQGYRFSDGWARDQHVYFRTRFSKPFTAVQMDTTAILKDGKRMGTATIARFDFDTQKGEQILVNTALSGVSMEGAAQNLAAEVPEDNFDKYREAARDNWNRQLSKIAVKGDHKDDWVNFYTALYHTMLAPTIYSDVDGSYYGPDKKIHRTDGWVNYSTFSLWDTYRAAHPLFTYTEPERTNDMVQSFLAFYEQNGRLPVWNFYGSETDMMIGYHAVPVIVDAYMKGYRNFDAKEAYKACLRAAEYDTTGIKCPDLVLPHLMPKAKYYKNAIGYIPCDRENESVAKALEYAYDDWCISIFAEAMSDFESKAKYERFAKAYEFYFDKSIRFMRGLDSKGEWRTPFNPRASTHRSDDYCEGTAWQWTWFVPHDVEGLVNLMGGEDAFVQKLDSLFSADSSLEGETTSSDISGLIGQYAHGNEPSHHVIHLYNYVNHPWRTQELVDSVYRSQYANSIEGLSGNEDCGQMSAWYILNSMGFYQVCPGKPVYSIGRPAFDKAVINLPEGKTFSIVVKNNGKKNKYIESVLLNGKALNIPFFNHQDIANGGTMEIKMTDHPTKWGVLSPALSSKEEE